MTHLVQTTSGPVRGRTDGAVVSYLGLPFSAPVGGEARWRDAAPPRRSTATIEADAWANPVPQMAETGGLTFTHLWSEYLDLPASEAGLQLNMWTPRDPRPGGAPVLVWLHGGGFATGQPTRPREDGTRFAQDGVIVVSPTHRLGVLGYLYLDELPGGWASANVGLTDIVLALQWVRDNIAAFGGDPANVTIIGESGGAAKVHALMSMPSARGLFHRAIMQAGAISSFGGIRVMTPGEATDLAREYLDAAGVTSPSELLTLSADAIVEADARFTGGSLLTWRPTVDGRVLPASPAEGPDRGSDVPLLIGSSRYEMDVLGTAVMSSAAVDPAQAERLRVAYRTPHLERDDDEVEHAIATDLMFRMPGIALAERRVGAELAPTYMYWFDFAYSNPDHPGFRASHGSETVFAFGTTAATALTADDSAAAALAEKVHAAWVSFVRTGDPNQRALPVWPAYELDNRATMWLRSEPSIISDPARAERLAWRPALNPRDELR